MMAFLLRESNEHHNTMVFCNGKCALLLHLGSASTWVRDPWSGDYINPSLTSPGLGHQRWHRQQTWVAPEAQTWVRLGFQLRDWSFGPRPTDPPDMDQSDQPLRGYASSTRDLDKTDLSIIPSVFEFSSMPWSSGLPSIDWCLYIMQSKEMRCWTV